MHNSPRERRDVESALNRTFEDPSLEVVEILPLPSFSRNRSVASAAEEKLAALRAFEEAMAIFDRSDEGCSQFIVQVRPKKKQPSASDNRTEVTHSTAGPHEGLYLGEGKLNIAYLLKNAEVLLRSGDYALARNIYRTIHQSGEKTAAALQGLGRCAEAEGKLAEAAEKYEESIAYHSSIEVFRILAQVYRKLGRDRHALETLERALTLRDLTRDERAQTHASCAELLVALKKPELAESHLRRSIEIKPTAEAFAQLASRSKEQQKLREAKELLQQAHQIDPGNAEILCRLAEIAQAEGDSRAAHDLYAKSLEAKIFNPNALFQLIKLAYDLKTYATATRIVEDYVRAAPVNVHLLYSLAGLQFHLGRTDASARTCQDILKISPDHAGAKDLLKLHSRQGGQDGDANRPTTG